MSFTCQISCRNWPVGQLYELDGRKSGAVSHGPCSPGSLLQVIYGKSKFALEDDCNYASSKSSFWTLWLSWDTTRDA